LREWCASIVLRIVERLFPRLEPRPQILQSLRPRRMEDGMACLGVTEWSDHEMPAEVLTSMLVDDHIRLARLRREDEPPPGKPVAHHRVGLLEWLSRIDHPGV